MKTLKLAGYSLLTVLINVMIMLLFASFISKVDQQSLIHENVINAAYVVDVAGIILVTAIVLISLVNEYGAEG